MKTKLLLAFTTLLSLATAARAQSTAFTYQGHLNDGGLPATGLYDFTFNVFDVEVDGAALAGTVVLDAVPVTNGLINASLDFGPGIFTGPARWLEITVRASGVGDPRVLTPRTPLLPTPYAIFAGSAGTVANGAVTADQLNTGGVPPALGQFLSYDGGNFAWADPGVAVGDVWSRNGLDAYYSSGNVGIGTISPISKLHVVSGPSDLPLRLESSGTAGFGAGWDFYHGTIGKGFVGVPDSAAAFGAGELMLFGGAGTKVSLWSAGNRRLTIDTGGKVGIGTDTPASKLTVFTPSGGLLKVGIEHTDGTIRLGTYVEPGYGAWLGTISNHPLNFFVNDGLPSVTIDGSGTTIVSGLGTLTVGSPNAESGTSIKRGNNRADVRFNGSTLKLVAGPGFGPPPSTFGVAIDTAGNVGVGTDAPLARLDVRGTTRTCILSIVGGCDLAEPFPLKEENIPQGSVVVIDDEHPGRLMRSDHAYDRRVAGIISGANGVNPGITLQQEGTLEGGQNVALSGRVYVQADAAFGAIQPGDLLTTSDTPGHAMRVADSAKAQGAILGKAMSALKAGQGLVLVLVTLQ